MRIAMTCVVASLMLRVLGKRKRGQRRVRSYLHTMHGRGDWGGRATIGCILHISRPRVIYLVQRIFVGIQKEILCSSPSSADDKFTC